MKSFDRRVHVALVAAGVMLLGARSASAWVAVRAPIARTVAVGVTAGAVAGRWRGRTRRTRTRRA